MSSEYYAKLARIIERLEERTLRGEVRWERTAGEGIFQSSFPDYSAVVSERINPMIFSHVYTFQIRNSEGQVVETVTDDQLTRENPAATDLIQDLHNAARRSALGADEAVNKMLQYLEV
jgi:hypothetical protein